MKFVSLFAFPLRGRWIAEGKTKEVFVYLLGLATPLSSPAVTGGLPPFPLQGKGFKKQTSRNRNLLDNRRILIVLVAIRACGETVIGAFLNDDPKAGAEKFQTSLDPVFLKDKHAVFFAGGNGQGGFGFVRYIIVLFFGIGIILGENVSEMQVCLHVGDVFKG